MGEIAPLSFDPARLHWTRINPYSARSGNFFIAEAVVLGTVRYALYQGERMEDTVIHGNFSRRKFAMEAAGRIKAGEDSKAVVAEIRRREGDLAPFGGTSSCA